MRLGEVSDVGNLFVGRVLLQDERFPERVSRQDEQFVEVSTLIAGKAVSVSHI